MGSIQGEKEGAERQGYFAVMKVEAGLQDKTMHLLPCGTNYSGGAAVEDYFKIKAAGQFMGSDLTSPLTIFLT